MKKFLIFFLALASAYAQSTVNGDRNFLGKVNATNATETQPYKAGPLTSRPNTCTVADTYFVTNATPGSNIYICTSANTWTQITGSSGSGTVTSLTSGNLSPLFTVSVANPTTTPALTFSLSSAAANSVFAGPNGAAGSPAFRALVGADIPAINPGSTGNGGFTALPTFTAGSNVTITGAWPNLTISATNSGSGWTIGPLSGLPPTPCAVGSAYFATDQPANQQLYTCSAANVWTQSMELGNSGALAVTGGALDITSTVPQKGTPNEWTALNTFDPGYVLKEQASGSTPATGFDMFYVNSTDHSLHMVNSAGTDTAIGSGGGGFTGTTGSVPFVGSGGTLTQQNANLFWDATNHRLGIGTNTPLSELDIVGAVGSAQFDASTGSANLAITGSALPYLKVENSGTSKYWEFVDNSDQSDGLMISPGTHTNGSIAANQTGSVFLGGTITDANAGTGASLAVTPTAITANQPLTVGNITINGTCTGTGCTTGSSGVAIQQGGVSQGSVSTLNCSTNVTCSVAGSVATVAASGGGFAGTAGSIPFVGSGGSLTQDNTNLFWDATNNRLNLGGAQATEGGQLDTVTHLDVAGGFRVVVDTGISLAGQGVLVCDTGNSCANFLLTGGGMTAIGRGAGAGTDIIAGDWNGNAFLGNVNSSSVANAEGSAAVSIMASENGHIYTHGSAPTLAGGGISALGIAVTHVGASVTSGSTAVTLSAANASIVVGQTISGADIAPGTTVSAISGTALTLSQAATGTNASETLGFATPESDNDSKGFVAFQSAGLAVLTFNTPWTSPPVCELTSGAPGSTVTAGSPSTTTLSIQLAGPTGSIDATVMYSCQGIK